MKYFLIIITIPYLVLLCKNGLHMLQQNFYNENNRYIKWCLNNLDRLLIRSDLILLVINLINLILKNNFLLVFNMLYLIFYIIKLRNNNKEQVKIPLKVTNRVKRLITTIVIIYLLIIFIPDVFAFCLVLSLLIYLYFIIVLVANYINIPVEKFVFNTYKYKALKKLKLMKDLEVIGITGSYGKTSSKNILNDILSVKYDVLKTPKNYNTQYGLILTINNYLDKFNEIFIAEMGAFKKGRIKLLCNLVKPKYGILTRIGEAHLETFGSIENVQEGKFELIEALPSDGLGILNMDDPYQTSYKLKNNCKILWIGIDNKKADVYASNIKIDLKGMNFDVTFKNQKTINFKTKLLGNANIYNILASLALANYLGMSDKELQQGVERIKPIEHRLELKKLDKYTIIDDAYNSNPVGSSMALDVLALMDGYKVVVTPGMIELGEKQNKYNYEFGQKISEVADYVILVGKNQTKEIYKGLKNKKYSEKNISIINDVKEAFKIINDLNNKDKETYILLENDLPDIFNEKE